MGSICLKLFLPFLQIVNCIMLGLQGNINSNIFSHKTPELCEVLGSRKIAIHCRTFNIKWETHADLRKNTNICEYASFAQPLKILTCTLLAVIILNFTRPGWTGGFRRLQSWPFTAVCLQGKAKQVRQLSSAYLTSEM